MSVWWWVLWVALVASVWGFCVGFFRALGYDIGLFFYRKYGSQTDAAEFARWYVETHKDAR